MRIFSLKHYFKLLILFDIFLFRQPRNIPIIFISALDDVTDKVKAFEAGAVDYVTKPFQHEEVIARVHTHLLLQTVKKQLQKSQQQLSQVIHSAMDAIISIDQTGNIVLFNNAAERIFCCSATKITGQPLSHFMSETLTKAIVEFIEQSAEQPMLWIPEGHHAIRANGSVFPIEATLSYCFDGERKLYTIILRDIETRIKTESERNHLRGINLYLQDELRFTQQSNHWESLGSNHWGQQIIGVKVNDFPCLHDISLTSYPHPLPEAMRVFLLSFRFAAYIVHLLRPMPC